MDAAHEKPHQAQSFASILMPRLDHLWGWRKLKWGKK